MLLPKPLILLYQNNQKVSQKSEITQTLVEKP